jgi:pimeloyl-ACP methyl ester carboxylesterase
MAVFGRLADPPGGVVLAREAGQPDLSHRAPPLSPLEMSVQSVDGLVLKGMLKYPAGSPGTRYPLAVLAHQYLTTADSYGPMVEDLLGLGVACLTFDQRGHGASIMGPSGPVVIDPPVGFTADDLGKAFASSVSRVGFQRIDNDILRVASWGAAQNFIDGARLILVGSSMGGSGAILTASQVPGLTALITYGAAGARIFGADAPQRIRAALETISVPCYLASSQRDPYFGGENATTWSAGLPRVKAKLVPGTAHGMAIYYEIREEVLAMIRSAIG